MSRFTSIFLYSEVKTGYSTRVKTCIFDFCERCFICSFPIESNVKLGHYMLFHVVYHDLMLMENSKISSNVRI